MQARVFASLCIWSLMACGGKASTDPSRSTSGTDGGVDNSDTSAPDSSTSSNPPKVPTDHRPTAEACTGQRPPGVSASDAAHFDGECHTDAECTKGVNGRCEVQAGFKLVCTYDECAQDSDCASGVCDCRTETRQGANTCFRGNCTTDKDCGGEYCSPSGRGITDNCLTTPSGPVPASSFGYFCHTRSDECTNDADCKGDESACVFQTASAKWACITLMCTGGVGEAP